MPLVPSVRPSVHPSACRSAPKIPGWNPWEPRRTELNAYNPLPSLARRPNSQPHRHRFFLPFSSPSSPFPITVPPFPSPRFLSRFLPRDVLRDFVPRGISIRDWFSLKRSKRIIASRRGNASTSAPFVRFDRMPRLRRFPIDTRAPDTLTGSEPIPRPRLQRNR